MRKLFWSAIGFAGGCALSFYLLPLYTLLLMAVTCITVGCALLCFRKRNWVRILAVLLLAASAAMLWYRGFDFVKLSPLRKLDGQMLEMTVTATQYNRETDYGSSLEVSARIDGKPVRMLVYLNTRDTVRPGDTLRCNFLLRYTAPGGSKEASSLDGSGIFLLAYPRGETEILPGEDSWRYIPGHLRKHILDRISMLFPEDAVAFLRSLLLGDTSGLDYATETALSISGLRHVAAVSGLHVSILFSVIYLFTWRNSILNLVFGVPVLLLFCAMAGFSPSVVRASVMQILMLLGMALHKDYDSPTALAAAVMLILLCNPLAVSAVSFQLSVASVAGILLFSERIKNWFKDEKRFGRIKKGSKKRLWAARFASAVSVSIGAAIPVLPFSAIYFGTVSLLGVVTNLLCLWVVTFLFCGTLVTLVVSLLWLPAAKLLGWYLAWAVRYVLAVAGLVAKFPLSAVYTVSPYIAAWLVIVYLLLGVYLFAKKKKPLALICCLIITLCASLTLSWIEPFTDDYRMTMLDVGQGQCILLQSDGKTYMVDCGGSNDEKTADTAANMLLSQGVFYLDGLILTHYDEDHIGAVRYLLDRIRVDLLIVPDMSDYSGNLDIILSKYEGEFLPCGLEMSITWEDSVLQIFGSENRKNKNESSLCVLFQKGNCDILITGDRGMTGEIDLLSDTALPKLDILVAGHHGSKDSTHEQLLAATRPELVLISVGKNNNYGHPDTQTLERLQAYGCKIRRTDLEGTIIIRG